MTLQYEQLNLAHRWTHLPVQTLGVGASDRRNFVSEPPQEAQNGFHVRPALACPRWEGLVCVWERDRLERTREGEIRCKGRGRDRWEERYRAKGGAANERERYGANGLEVRKSLMVTERLIWTKNLIHGRLTPECIVNAGQGQVGLIRRIDFFKINSQSNSNKYFIQSSDLITLQPDKYSFCY